jgi:hypothetical protein
MTPEKFNREKIKAFFDLNGIFIKTSSPENFAAIKAWLDAALSEAIEFGKESNYLPAATVDLGKYGLAKKVGAKGFSEHCIALYHDPSNCTSYGGPKKSLEDIIREELAQV